jgi:L-threonylcarbamoyladenylate synthase
MKTIIGTTIQEAIHLLKSGELVAIPTETVYGLAANGCNTAAVKKIYEAKNRPNSNPLILHFASSEKIHPYVLDFPQELLNLANKFWPGPLTILLKKSELVPNEITANQELVAVRVPNHPLLNAILSELDFPLAAPSANLYGMVSPTKAEHVMQDLNGKIPYILDGGSCENGLESTIIGLHEMKVVVYRLGSISLEDLTAELSYTPELKNTSEKQVITSGMVEHHYAPKTPFFFFDETSIDYSEKNNGFIFFKDKHPSIDDSNKIILSKSGDLKEAAANLYDAIIEMDKREFTALFIERLPDFGLGKTMNDRLNRSTLKFRE